MPTVLLQVVPPTAAQLPPIAIESVVERPDVKRTLLADLQRWLGEAATLCTNTSTLRIGGLSEGMVRRDRCCGMHFFMPVDQRPLVEVVVPEGAAAQTVDDACLHAGRLGKQTLRVRDSPGFVVNRLLAPYLNEAMRMLGAGAAPQALQRAALQLGMPMSPLELVDLIGIRTAFDAGRVYWQAFPHRLDPAPILPGMLKARLVGRAAGEGFFSYSEGPAGGAAMRSAELAPAAQDVLRRYARGSGQWDESEIALRLSLTMLIEASLILIDRVVSDTQQIELAMRGGLGLDRPGGFLASFDALGAERCAEAVERLGDERAFAGAARLIAALRRSGSRSVTEAFADLQASSM